MRVAKKIRLFYLLAFTEEPLYQVYQAVVFEKERTLSLKRGKKGSSVKGVSPARGRAFTFGTGTLRGGKMLWSQLPEVGSALFMIWLI